MLCSTEWGLRYLHSVRVRMGKIRPMSNIGITERCCSDISLRSLNAAQDQDDNERGMERELPMTWGPEASLRADSLHVVQLVARFPCENSGRAFFENLVVRGWIEIFEVLRDEEAVSGEALSEVSFGAWTSLFIHHDEADCTRVLLADAVRDVATLVDASVVQGILRIARSALNSLRRSMCMC